MKFSLTELTQLITLLGLSGLSITEALRPGTIGAAVNLGLVVLLVTGLLVVVRKS